MRPPRPIGEEAKESLKKAMKQTKTKADFQRVQCVWLRAQLGLSSSQVAHAVGWSPGTVRRLWSVYFSQGEQALLGQGRGGRRHAHLSVAEEQRLLARFFEPSAEGEVLVVNEVKAAYEQAVGHTVPKSTVYRLLARHGWRKIAPRPRHPKADLQKQQAFKKTPGDRQ